MGREPRDDRQRAIEHVNSIYTRPARLAGPRPVRRSRLLRFIWRLLGLRRRP